MIEAAFKRYLLDQRDVVAIVNENIFAGRIPQYRLKDESVDTAILIYRITGDTFPDLPGEGTCEVATLQVEAFGRGQGAELRVYKAMREVQKATVENAFTGYMGHGEHRHWVMGMSTVRIGGRIPVSPYDNSDVWTHRFSRDIRITFDHGDE